VPLAKFMRFGAAAPSQHMPPRHHSRRSYRLAPRALQAHAQAPCTPGSGLSCEDSGYLRTAILAGARVGELPRAEFVPVALDHTGSALRAYVLPPLRRQAKPGGVGSLVNENATENF
jgi:hypothetical protein